MKRMDFHPLDYSFGAKSSKFEVMLTNQLCAILGICRRPSDFDMFVPEFFRDGRHLYLEFDGAFYHKNPERDRRKCDRAVDGIVFRICKTIEAFAGMKNVVALPIPRRENWQDMRDVLACVEVVMLALRRYNTCRDAAIASWDGKIKTDTWNVSLLALVAMPPFEGKYTITYRSPRRWFWPRKPNYRLEARYSKSFMEEEDAAKFIDYVRLTTGGRGIVVWDASNL